MITMIAPFPPPMGGASKNSEIVYRRLIEAGCEIEKINLVNTAGLSHSRSISYNLSRIWRHIQIIARLLRSLLRGSRVFYLVPPGGVALPLTAMEIALIKIFGGIVYLHHRSYGYIRSNRMSMRYIAKLSGIKHIFLSEGMARDFMTQYKSIEYIVISNLAFLDVEISCENRRISKLHNSIGYLSNLSTEKGFALICEAFIDLFEAEKGLSFHLAGCPTTELERLLLENLKKVLGDRLTYWGEVGVSEKARFYSAIDVFIFPTVFEQEAQPNVVFEAMANGCFVISTNLGDIPEMVEPGASTILMAQELRSQEIVNAALDGLNALGAGEVPRQRVGYRMSKNQATATSELDAVLSELKQLDEKLGRGRTIDA